MIAKEFCIVCTLLVAPSGTFRLARHSTRFNTSSRGPDDSIRGRANLIGGKLFGNGPRQPPRFAGVPADLEGNLSFGKKPPVSQNSAKDDNCQEEVLCKSYIKELTEKEYCPTRKEKMMMTVIRRAMLHEEHAGTVSEAVEKVKEQLMRFHPVANPTPMTLEAAEELVKHPTGRLWELIESEKGTAEMWCQGGGNIAVDMPKEVKPIPDPVELVEEETVLETKGPTQRAGIAFNAQELFRQYASIGKSNGIIREAGRRILVKVVQANPLSENQPTKRPLMANKAVEQSPKPYGLPKLDSDPKLDQNLGLMLRRLDFSLKENNVTSKWFTKGQVDYIKVFQGLFRGLPAIVGNPRDKESAKIADLILTALNQVPSADRDELLNAAAADDVLKNEGHSLESVAPAGLKPTAAFIRAWARHRTQDPQKVAKCALARFSEPETVEKAKTVVKHNKHYYSIFKRFSEHISDAISQFVAAFFSAELDFYRAESQMTRLAEKDYRAIEEKILKLATIKGLKDKLANSAHPLADAVLPLLAIANVFNKNDFNLRATSGQGPKWKPSLLDTFLYFTARASNEPHAAKSLAFIHSLTGADAPWNGHIGKLKRPGHTPDTWNVDVPKKGSKQDIPEANLAVVKTLLDTTVDFCRTLVSRSNMPTWAQSLGKLREDIKSLAKELMACESVKLPPGESIDSYIQNVDTALAWIQDAERAVVDALGPSYLSLLPENVYNGSSVDMLQVRPELLNWQKMATNADDKSLPHPQGFVSLFDDYTLRTNIHGFCLKVDAGSKLAWSEHFHL